MAASLRSLSVDESSAPSKEWKKNVYAFQDLRSVPDEIREYSSSLINEHTPILIDNGSYQCRAGWLSDEKPSFMFRNVIAKSRGRKDGDMEILIGNEISNIELVRWSLKTQFDRDVVTHYDAQEQIFDHIFSRLGINTHGSVNHPVVLSECVCNPNYSRQLMNELLFECYQIPQVAFGIDSLFSLYYNQSNEERKNALVISSGYQVSHILPVVNGKLDSKSCKRINVGGSQVVAYMQKLLQLKYPGHAAQITLSRAQEIVHDHSYIAPDYQEELSRWLNDDFSDANERVMQLPFTQPSNAQNANPKDEEKERLRKEKQGRRLQEVNCKKLQDKLAEEETLLKKLFKIRKLENSETKFKNALTKEGFSTVEEFQLAIENLSNVTKKRGEKVKKIQASIRKLESSSNVKDKAMEAKEKKQKVISPEVKEWLASLHSRRQKILDKRQRRQQRKDDLSKRRSAASIERMRIISKLAHDPNIREDGSLRGGHKKPKDDTFGMNDDDWMVYRHISKDAGDSDSEREQEELGEIENVLKKHDPDFLAEEDNSQVMDVESYYQLTVGIERCRVPEVLFQPSMLGVEQAGIAEVVEFILKKYPPAIQNNLVQNIFVTGGNAQYTNFCTRLEKELLAFRPFQSTFKVNRASNFSLDSWLGMRQWARTVSDLSSVSITRQDYEEKGGEYLKEHQLSNHFIPTPSLAS
ncbi:actin-related protein 5-like [Xenia sp. Carnegie-2017]|uniref:actin-related protein 5-like n=1 Tax=Xenia sp. Carnegie-2017 TaxID=2897299 RepID=UPI001F04FA98|nr:actin-related protein 5-like [Xenia sp. Carnegie-2017]